MNSQCRQEWPDLGPARFDEHRRVPPQGSKTARSKERHCAHSEKATPWIPACAGMTEVMARGQTDRKTPRDCRVPSGDYFGQRLRLRAMTRWGNKPETPYWRWFWRRPRCALNVRYAHVSLRRNKPCGRVVSHRYSENHRKFRAPAASSPETTPHTTPAGTAVSAPWRQ